MDRFDELQVFVTVVQQGSLAAAARQLHRSAPVITRTLAALEQRMEATLIERTTRKLAPTEAGWQLFEQARQLLQDYHQTIAQVQLTRLQGLLRITAPLQFGRLHVIPLVERFLQQWPELQVELLFHDSYQDLIENQLDIAVRIGHLQDSRMVARQVGMVQRVLLASPQYLADAGSPHHPSDLSQHSLISGTDNSGEWRFADGLRQRIQPRFRVNDVESRLQLLRHHQGIGRLLSYQAHDDLQQGTLVQVLPQFESDSLPVQLLTHRVAFMPAKVRHFWDFALENLPLVDCFNSNLIRD